MTAFSRLSRLAPRQKVALAVTLLVVIVVAVIAVTFGFASRAAAFASIVLVFLLTAGGAYLLTRGDDEPIRELAAVAEAFARGDFTARAPSPPGELGRLGEALNATALYLQQQYGDLEQRMAERARALETSIEVGRQLATIHDVDALVAAVVQQIQASFGYYHVHVYLLDEHGDMLVMAGGTGEAGRTMLAQGHRLELGQGLVGLSARHNEPVLAPDTRANPDWLPNPLLPETNGEIAVPISYGDRLLGVLDVQHDVAGSLGADDVALLEAVAGQVAVALQNARLLHEAGERSRQAALAYVIAQRIQRANSVEEVLRLAAQELGQALGSERARVQLRAVPYVTAAEGPATTPEASPERRGNT
jgi:GAF domain-containing protein/HAMP domain-containing protein